MEKTIVKRNDIKKYVADMSTAKAKGEINCMRHI